MRGERQREGDKNDSGDDSVRAGEGADDGSATRGRVEKGATREQDIASDDLTYVERRGVHAKKGENRTQVGLVVRIVMRSTGAGGLLK